MISADHFHDSGDGSAWVVHDDYTPAFIATLDRPCDTCGGAKRYAVVADGQMVGWQNCQDCDGSGRHVFEVEVACEACADRHDHPIGNSSGGRTLRVYIVTVLPIYGDHDEAMDAKSFSYCVIGDDNLPPAAKSGMWAVKLKSH